MAMWSCPKCKTTYHEYGEQIVIVMVEHEKQGCKGIKGPAPEVLPLDLGIDKNARARRR